MGPMQRGCFSLFLPLFLCFNPSFLLKPSPFAIDFPVKEELSDGGYLFVQEELRKINIAPLIEKTYCSESNLLDFKSLMRRCSRGIRETLIDPQKGQYPLFRLEQIGAKSDRCIASFTSYDGVYPDLVRRLPDLLREVGFNGLFSCRTR
jgi:hypothetical protein